MKQISVVDPIGRAFESTRLILFRPFEMKKWFTLGFCAFLATLGESGHGSVNYRGDGPDVEEIKRWVLQNLATVLLVAAVVVAFVVALSVVFLWLSSRGKFMFLDGVVHNRGAVDEPWRRFRRLGNNLFKVKVVLMFVALAAWALVGAICVATAWPDIEAQRWGSPATAAAIVGAVLILGLAVVFGVIQFVLEDFVVPAMYRFDVTAGEAWTKVRAEVLAGNVATVVLYALMKIVLVVGIAVIATVAACLTCCLAALPYLGTVILLPLFVFIRCYALHFLEQFGESWRFFPAGLTPPS